MLDLMNTMVILTIIEAIIGTFLGIVGIIYVIKLILEDYF